MYIGQWRNIGYCATETSYLFRHSYVEMSMPDIDHALGIIESLLDDEADEKKQSDLSQLHEILKSTKVRVTQSITFDSFTGAIELEDEDCSGYLQVNIK